MKKSRFLFFNNIVTHSSCKISEWIPESIFKSSNLFEYRIFEFSNLYLPFSFNSDNFLLLILSKFNGVWMYGLLFLILLVKYNDSKLIKFSNSILIFCLVKMLTIFKLGELVILIFFNLEEFK